MIVRCCHCNRKSVTKVCAYCLELLKDLEDDLPEPEPEPAPPPAARPPRPSRNFEPDLADREWWAAFTVEPPRARRGKWGSA